MNDELSILFDVIKRLDQATIPYMVTGSMAMAFYATPRMTRDVDIIINLLPMHANKVYDLFKDDYYIDKETVRQAILDRGDVQYY